MQDTTAGRDIKVSTFHIYVGTGAAQDRVLERDAEGRLSVAGVVEALAEEEREETPIGPNPYKGLAAFDEKDGERFFGRRAITERLWEAFRSLQEPGPGANAVRILPILGPSGSATVLMVPLCGEWQRLASFQWR